MDIQPFTEGNFFHIYNRGINGSDIFFDKKNYQYFLQQYTKYCAPVLETYAYALLKNHFHAIVYVKQNVIVQRADGKGMLQLNASKQLSHFFNSYAQSINKVYGRTGSLLESPFERKLIDNDAYITNAILYCHYNPQLHGFVQSYKDWEFTSYQSILNKDRTFLAIDKIYDWFGGAGALVNIHETHIHSNEINKYSID